MRTKSIFLILVLVALFCLSGCKQNDAVKTGILEISIGSSDNSKGIEPTPMEITSFSITVTDTSSNVVFSKTIKADDGSGSCRLQLPVGNYTVKVSAFNKEDKKIGEGSSAVSVVMGQVTQCSVAVHEIEGKGTVSFVFSGAEEDEIAVEIFDASMSRIENLSLDYAEGVFSGSIELDNGFYYFTVSKSNGEILKSDAVRVLADQVISIYDPAALYETGEVEIIFYHNMGNDQIVILDKYIREFNKSYPSIHIQAIHVDSYDSIRDQISTEIMIGKQPNLSICYPDHVALYNLANAVKSLDDLIDSTIQVKKADGTTEILGLTAEQKADFIEGYYNEGKQFGDGLMYTMPLSKSTEVLYYNKTFFDANGIKVPTTWDEMEQVCAQIKAIDPNSIPLGYDSEANWFITMCEQYNSPYTSATEPHYLFNNEQNIAFIKMFRDWYQKGYLTTQKLYGAYTSGLFTSTTGVRSYMTIGSSASSVFERPSKKTDGTYPFEVGIATIPQVSESNRKVISQGPSLCIFDKANPQEVVASWIFVKYLTTDIGFQLEYSLSRGYVPVIKAVADNAVYSDYLATADGGDNITALSAKVCLEQQDAYYISPAFNGSATARDQVGALLPKCLTLTDDNQIRKAFQEALDECEYHN